MNSIRADSLLRDEQLEEQQEEASAGGSSTEGSGTASTSHLSGTSWDGSYESASHESLSASAASGRRPMQLPALLTSHDGLDVRSSAPRRATPMVRLDAEDPFGMCAPQACARSTRCQLN